MIKHLNLKLESYGTSNFLFFQVPSDVEINGKDVDFLTNKKRAGLLPTTDLKKEDLIYVRFDQISDISLDTLFSRTLTKEQLMTHLVNIVDSLAQLEKSTLDFENILLDKKHIFLDHFSNRLVFMYLLIKDNVFEKVSMSEFFKELLSSTVYDEMDDLSFFIKLHNYLAGTATLDLREFKEKLTEFGASRENRKDAVSETNSNFYSPGKMTSAVATSVDQGVLTSAYSSSKEVKKKSQKLEIEEEVQYKRITRTELGTGDSLLKGAESMGATSINIVPNYQVQELEEEHEGTTVLGAFSELDENEEGTTALGVENQKLPKPFLIEAATLEKIVVTKDVFKLGRDPEQADYASKNKVVGRIHAELVSVDGEYFLLDKHSRNGSYLNGVKLYPNEKAKIKHEDKIKLANQEFVFKLF
jgi:Domain of unknown function (DUF6382)/FHA domain